jgi:hypothetical protein
VEWTPERLTSWAKKTVSFRQGCVKDERRVG